MVERLEPRIQNLEMSIKNATDATEKDFSWNFISANFIERRDN